MEQQAVAALAEFKRHKAAMNLELREVMTHLDGMFQEVLADGALWPKQNDSTT